APLELEAALHTYLAVADVREIAIDGLGGAAFLDNTRELAADVQGEQTLRLTGPTDRIYDSAPRSPSPIPPPAGGSSPPRAAPPRPWSGTPGSGRPPRWTTSPMGPGRSSCASNPPWP